MSTILHETQDLDQFIHGEVFVPSILVLGTERAIQMVRETNHLSLIDLLTPFGGFYTPITCSYRVLDKSIKQHGMKVKFVDTLPTTTSSTRILSTSSRTTAFESWFGSFNREHLSWKSDFEAIDQTIATVLVVSSDDPSPVDCFEQLSHVANQPVFCRQGILDPTSARVKILLHNNLSTTRSYDDAQSIANQLVNIYAANSVIFLPINHQEQGDVEIKNLFSKHVTVNPVPVTAGFSLSWDDIDRLNRACECIVTQNAIPWMEKKLSQLDATITAKRKGFRNQLKNFLRPIPDTASSGGPGGTTGPMTLQQVEWQCRLAGDLAFHLRHYELAFSYYRNVASDLKTDKFYSQSAGCYEMSGLCGVLMPRGDVSLGEISRFFDTAIELYKTVSLGNACIRAGIFQSYALVGRPEAAEKLIKINGAIPDNGIRCAMVLDRAASLHGLAGMKRKESFTRVLAGHMFNKIEGMKPGALDCYSSVLDKYTRHDAKSPEWRHIVDHLLFTMAKIEFGIGNIHAASIHLVHLFQGVAANADDEKPPGTAEKHANYVKLLTYIGKALVQGVERFELSLPEISIEETEIMMRLKNPLMVPIEISSLRVVGGHQTEEYSMSLGPLEERVIPLSHIGKRIEWILFSSFNCFSNV